MNTNGFLYFMIFERNNFSAPFFSAPCNHVKGLTRRRQETVNHGRPMRTFQRKPPFQRPPSTRSATPET